MWDFRCPQLAGRAGSLLPEQPNCQGNQTAPAPTLNTRKRSSLVE